MDCQDRLRDKVNTKTTEAEMLKYRGDIEGCMVKCADTHVALLPNMMKRIKDVLVQAQSQTQKL